MMIGHRSIFEWSFISIFIIFSGLRIYNKIKTNRFFIVKEAVGTARKVDFLIAVIIYQIITFFLLIFTNVFDWASVELHPFWQWQGIIVGFGSIAMLYWVHHHLSVNWSPRLELRQGHELITTGPYARIRHPMYSAFFLLNYSVLLLTANLFIGLTWLSAIAFVIVPRISKEEKMLKNMFGARYEQYMGCTGRFFLKIGSKAFDC